MRPAKRENQKTRKRERFWPFSRFRVSRCSHLHASLIASLIDCNMLLDANTAFLLSPFSGLRVFAVFGFSRFRVFAVFGFSPFSRFCRFRVFAFSCSQVDSSRFRVFVLSHVQSWRFRATECSASVHTLHMPKALTTVVFIVLRNGLRRYILHTCLKVWKPSCSKCYRKFCLATYFTHAQRCENVFKVLRNGLLGYIIYTCPQAWKPSCSKCYKKDCFGTYFTHAQNCHDLRVQRATESSASVHNLHMPKIKLWQRVHSATQWTASVHTLHMPKGVKTFVFKVLQKFLPRYITCMPKSLTTCS